MMDKELEEIRNKYRQIVNLIYSEILRRPADKDGLEYFVSHLMVKALTIDDVRKTILESEEGRAMQSNILEDKNTTAVLVSGLNPELKNKWTKASCNICGSSGDTFWVRKYKFNTHEKNNHSQASNSQQVDNHKEQKEINRDCPSCWDYGLSEILDCKFCRCISRDRMLIYGLSKVLNKKLPLSQWKEDKSIKILDSSARRSYPIYLEEKFDYLNTHYNPEKISLADRQYADFQSLQYDSDSFNIVLSSGVFEHIRLHVNALKEVYRVLKKGGKFLLQTPYCHDWPDTFIKVEPHGDKDIFLIPPDFHEEDTLEYRIYGRDLLTLLENIGFSVEYTCTRIPDFMISLQPIILCTK